VLFLSSRGEPTATRASLKRHLLLPRLESALQPHFCLFGARRWEKRARPLGKRGGADPNGPTPYGEGYVTIQPPGGVLIFGRSLVAPPGLLDSGPRSPWGHWGFMGEETNLVLFPRAVLSTCLFHLLLRFFSSRRSGAAGAGRETSRPLNALFGVSLGSHQAFSGGFKGVRASIHPPV